MAITFWDRENLHPWERLLYHCREKVRLGHYASFCEEIPYEKQNGQKTWQGNMGLGSKRRYRKDLTGKLFMAK